MRRLLVVAVFGWAIFNLLAVVAAVGRVLDGAITAEISDVREALATWWPPPVLVVFIVLFLLTSHIGVMIVFSHSIRARIWGGFIAAVGGFGGLVATMGYAMQALPEDPPAELMGIALCLLATAFLTGYLGLVGALGELRFMHDLADSQVSPFDKVLTTEEVEYVDEAGDDVLLEEVAEVIEPTSERRRPRLSLRPQR